jgi:hypothetical protein
MYTNMSFFYFLFDVSMTSRIKTHAFFDVTDLQVLIRPDPLGNAVAPYAGRGLKLFNLAHRMGVMPTPNEPRGGLVFVMCTAFDMSSSGDGGSGGGSDGGTIREPPFVVETKTLGNVTLPRLRILAYEPNTSHRMQLLIGGSALLESISSSGAIDEELLVESRRLLLGKFYAGRIGT